MSHEFGVKAVDKPLDGPFIFRVLVVCTVSGMAAVSADSCPEDSLLEVVMGRQLDIEVLSTDSRDSASLTSSLLPVESTTCRTVIYITNDGAVVLPTPPNREALLTEALDALTSAATDALPAAILSLRRLPRR